MGWVRKKSIWGGVCSSCATRLDSLHEAWLDGAGAVRCLRCGPGTDEPAHADTLVAAEPRPEGSTAGAPRGARPRRVAGLEDADHPTERALAELLAAGGRVLADRVAPGGAALGHVVVASSGVWVVQSRDWAGRVEYRPSAISSGRHRLFVGGIDRTTEVEAVGELADALIPLAGSGVPVEPALAITLGDWNLASLPSLVLNRPLQHGPVWIAPPRLLVARINAPGPLGPDDVQRVSALLEEHLAER